MDEQEGEMAAERALLSVVQPNIAEQSLALSLSCRSPP